MYVRFTDTLCVAIGDRDLHIRNTSNCFSLEAVKIDEYAGASDKCLLWSGVYKDCLLLLDLILEEWQKNSKFCDLRATVENLKPWSHYPHKIGVVKAPQGFANAFLNGCTVIVYNINSDLKVASCVIVDGQEEGREWQFNLEHLT